MKKSKLKELMRESIRTHISIKPVVYLVEK
jgi:hypothetical protein